MLVEIGQRWKRSNGVIVELTDMRNNKGTREFKMVPVTIPDGAKAKTSWKWDGGIKFEMELVSV